MSKFIDDADNQDEYCRTCGLPPDYDFDALVEHCRALEAMLRKHSEKALEEYPWCLICGNSVHMGKQGHSPDCELARLING